MHNYGNYKYVAVSSNINNGTLAWLEILKCATNSRMLYVIIKVAPYLDDTPESLSPSSIYQLTNPIPYRSLVCSCHVRLPILIINIVRGV